jgi:hypothetical protein
MTRVVRAACAAPGAVCHWPRRVSRAPSSSASRTCMASGARAASSCARSYTALVASSATTACVGSDAATASALALTVIPVYVYECTRTRTRAKAQDGVAKTGEGAPATGSTPVDLWERGVDSRHQRPPTMGAGREGDGAAYCLRMRGWRSVMLLGVCWNMAYLSSPAGRSLVSVRGVSGTGGRRKSVMPASRSPLLRRCRSPPSALLLPPPPPRLAIPRSPDDGAPARSARSTVPV